MTERRHILMRCCRCHVVRVNGRWIRVDRPPYPRAAFSYGYCPACGQRARAEAHPEAVRVAC